MRQIHFFNNCPMALPNLQKYENVIIAIKIPATIAIITRKIQYNNCNNMAIIAMKINCSLPSDGSSKSSEILNSNYCIKNAIIRQN